MSRTALITVEGIGTRFNFNRGYAGQLTLRKGFPEPEEIIGVNKMYDPRKVAKFLADRKARGRKRAS